MNKKTKKQIDSDKVYELLSNVEKLMEEVQTLMQTAKGSVEKVYKEMNSKANELQEVTSKMTD